MKGPKPRQWKRHIFGECHEEALVRRIDAAIDKLLEGEGATTDEQVLEAVSILEGSLERSAMKRESQ